MNTDMITPAAAHLTARELFLLLHRGQAKWFDLAWQHRTDSRSASQSTIPPDEGMGLGVAGASENVTRMMAKQFADLAATFLIRSPVARRELLARLQKNLAKDGRPDALVNWLIQSAAATLDQFSPGKNVFVSSLFKAKLERDRECEGDAFEDKLQARTYDIVVNEPAHSIRVLHRDGIVPPEIIKVSPMQRGMLWLALTHVGDLLEHKEIGDLFNFDSTEPTESGRQPDRVVNKIYQYPTALREMVGEHLYRRMLKAGAGRANQVARGNWSFVWVRKCRDERDSELLHGMRESARWSKHEG